MTVVGPPTTPTVFDDSCSATIRVLGGGALGSKGACCKDAQHALGEISEDARRAKVTQEFIAVLAGGARGGRYGGARERGSTASPDRPPPPRC